MFKKTSEPSKEFFSLNKQKFNAVNAKYALTKEISVNHLSVNTQSSDFSDCWPKPHSVNAQFGESGTDETH